MAKVTPNPLFGEFHGRLGNLVFRKSSTGKMYVSQLPKKSTKEPSEAQKAHRLRFKQAAAYAKAVLADPDLRAQYEKQAARQGISAYSLVVADYMNGTPTALTGTFAKNTVSAPKYDNPDSE